MVQSSVQAFPRERPSAPVPTRRARSASAHRRLGPALRRAVLRELTFPTLFALGGIAFLVLAVDFVGYADLVVNRGYGAGGTVELAVYRLLPALGRALPFAVLVGTLVALGRLGSDHETTALEACGVSARALTRPVMLFAGVFALLGAMMSLVVTPAAIRGFDALLISLAESSSEAGTPLRAGVVERIGSWRIFAREVSPRGDRLRGVVLWAPPLDGTVFAEKARVSGAAPASAGQPAGRRLEIENGVVVTELSGTPSQVRFGHLEQTLTPSPARESAQEWAAGASVEELVSSLRSDSDPKRLREARQEWHQRLALPLASLLFALLAVGLVIARPRPTRSSGVVTALAILAVYYGLLQLGSGLARAQPVPIAVTVWLPNLVLAAAGLWLLATAPAVRSGRRVRVFSTRMLRRGQPQRLRLHRLRLDRYVLHVFLELALLCFALLLAAYLALDVLDNLKWFTKYRSTPDEVLLFYLARLPMLASRVVPMALLLGAALTLSLLGTTGELIGMRACGVSTLRVVTPVLLACGLAAVGYHFLANDLVPRANARASQIKHTEIKNKSTVRSSVWSLSGDRLLEATRLDPVAGFASDLVVYELDRDGLPSARIDARQAIHVGNGVWRLVDPQRFALDADGMRRVEAESFLRLGEDATVEVEGEHLSTGDLRREIDTLEAHGYDATTFRVDLALKLAAPLACFLLPALALLFATGGPPFPTPVHTLVACAFAASGWLLVSALGASLGYRGAVPPWVAGFGPVAVLAGSAAILIGRIRGFGRSARG